MKTNKIVDLALGQLDNLGYQLQKRGITSVINRHNLIAIAMTKQDRIKAEISRVELKVDIQKARVERLRQQADDIIDTVIDSTPAPIAEKLTKVRSLVA
ncbi:hypothetical protein A9Q99_16435 [Gammaproteobacteria bacterium 45_16_T64]|nr:hypothetical protein A9Q99_16435 [Gammaproteobacteria bacterium 45_16_T64]